MLLQHHLVYVGHSAGVCCRDGLLRGVTDILSNFRLRGLPPRFTPAKISINLSIDETLFTWLEVGHCWQVTIDEELSCIRMIATCLNVYAAQIDKTLLVFKLIYIADTVLNILVYKIYHKYIRI